MSNSFSEALANAKPLKSKSKPASKGTNGKKHSGEKSTKPAEQPAALSLRDRLRQTTEAVRNAQELRTALVDADDCQNDKDVIDGYVELINQLDTLAIYMLSQNRTRNEAHEEWFDMDWEDQETQLKDWADKGNELAQSIMKNLEPFNSNPLLREFLRQIVVEFVTPLKWINTWAGLRKLLDNFVEQEWVKPINRPTRVPENSVVIPGPEGETLYIPVKGMRVIQGGWPFVLEVSKRVKSIEDAIQGLRDKATPGLTPEKVSLGQDGVLFLRTGGTRAMILECTSQGGWTTVAVSDSIGFEEGQLPMEETQWDESNHRPQVPPGKSKWHWIAKAMDDTAKYHQQVAQRARKEQKNRLGPIVSLANMPLRFEDLSLIRLVQGENGTIAIWNNRFRWGKNQTTGLFGIALERIGDQFVLLEVVTDFHFPKTKLIGEYIPVVWDMEKLVVKMLHKPNEDKDVYAGLEMICRLLYLRLRTEKDVAVVES